MNKKISLGAAIAFMVVIAGITFCITMMVSLNHFNTMVLNVKSREEMYKKLADIDREVRQNFDGTIDEEALMDSISTGFIKGIGDKNATYLTKDQYEQKMKDLSGSEVGIGIKGEKDESGYFVVKKILAGSPAEKGGVQVNDHIVSMAEIDAKTISNENMQRLMKGEVGTKLKLTYRRDGTDTPIDLIRTDVSFPLVELEMLDTNALIKISTINDLTHTQFKSALDDAIKKNATALIFDLRNCSGDSLSSVKTMLNIILPAGDMGTIVDKKGGETVLGVSDKYQINLPMAVIMNTKTTGTAELFIASLRDYNKINSVGLTTSGKSTIQTLIKLTDGSAVNITTAHFYPPSGDEINNIGIKPDYEVRLSAEQEKNFEMLMHNEDMQLQKAVEVVNSKKPK